ncbi:hypothetical protein [Kangiella spongicola]|uniref:Uncharacterized protein n=1 Tax=Kangiella spongicola TaxID=796379 RepID=A0A318D0S7_9GAMM|nr:hypothetical protein [Kangiella spongicola]PXF62810.1 hypothetical protein DL796_10850 [Kangiella spongicola]
MIIKDNSQLIDDFKGLLKGRLDGIDKLDSSTNNGRIYKQILYVSFLDSLAASIYPGRNNKSRFLSLVREFSNWEYGERVCLLHLGKMVTLVSDPELAKLRTYVLAKLKEWSQQQPLRKVLIQDLPQKKEIQEYWSKSNKEKGINYCLDDFTHINLLYQLRNSLVHQFQSKGTELGTQIPDQPFYEFIVTMDKEKNFIPQKIELVYPTSFLKKLTDETFCKVINYFKKGNLNPFPYYYSGDYSLEHLNNS